MTHPSHKIINLALQGGGAHGAFTWGVLEELLIDGRTTFKTISATSAGSMNAVVLTQGLLNGGADGAIKLLESFWRKVSSIGRGGIFAPPKMMDNFLDPMGAFSGMAAAGAIAGFDMFSRMFSPYQFNPLGLNPLRDVLNEIVDFKALQTNTLINLHISATDVLNSRLKIFTDSEITADAVMASACLPQLFQAVKVNDRYYWDGGFMGNPTLFPLTHCTATHDILIVKIDPFTRGDLPTTAEAITDRLNEITFNSPLLVELRGLHLINHLFAQGHLHEDSCGLRRLFLHMISDEKTMADLPLESKFNPDWDMLQKLRALVRASTKIWLHDHFDAIGVRSSFDLGKLLD